MMQKIKNIIKRIRWRMVVGFFLFEAIFIGITSPLLVFYGPFKNLTRTIVGTSMATFKHQYIAKTFLSDDSIQRILASREVDSSEISSGEGEEIIVNPAADIDEQQKSNDIKVPVKHDETIERYDIEGRKSKGVLLVIKDPKRVRVGYTNKLGVEGQRTSDIAKENNAVAAINGGAFTDRSNDGKIWCGTGGLPGGILIVDGKIVYSDIGNNDTKIRDTVAMTYDGVLVVGPHSVNELMEMKVRDAICFSPTIILNGKALSNYSDQGINPRTAIGQRKDGAILFLVMDGRQARSVGSTLDEVRNIMFEHGAWNAINLDGGSSTTMYLNGEIINNPCDPYGERTIATALYVEP